MSGDSRVLGLLEEMLDTGTTPEEVCRGCPELLTEVRERWKEFRLIDAAVVEMLPGLQTPHYSGAVTPVPAAPDLPQVPGYELFDEVGRGGMGVVYRARDISLDRDVAVKLLQDSFSADSPIGRRFTDEARITAQLQHPGIPAVYRVGALPDRRPFLAMKLIKGRTLAAMLRERPDVVADRGRYVAIFEHVCQAVAYAHSLRVIHRDLKPANVMVGKFGEVQVMDWGLAKVLRDEGVGMTDEKETCDVSSSSLIPHPSSLPGTRAGSVLGTPAYMAPEQAGGEVDRLDPRSDVFGLGAILCEVLTGQPPYSSRDEGQIFRQAMYAKQAEAHGRLADCQAEPELVALCVKCLAPEPDDRPGDAGEVAAAVAALRAAAEERARQAELDRVRTAEEGKRRRVLLAASATIAVVLLAGLGVSLWQTRRAERALHAEQVARQDEAKAREQAFAALRSMTAEVVERKFAAGAVLTDDDRAFLRGVIAQFDAFAAIKGDDADSRAVRAEGRLRVGWMRNRLGELREAEQDYDQAVSIFNQLAADFPSRPELRRQLASSHNHRGALLHATGRLPEALKDWTEALSIQNQLVAALPSRPEFRQELAGSHLNRGVLLDETGRLKEAEKDYDQALNIQRQLAADFPSRPEFRQDLANSHNNRGILLSGTGRLKEAEKDYDQAASILKQLVADVPSRPEFRQDMAASLLNRGVLLRGMGRMKEAETDYDQALGIYQQLAAELPSRPELRRELASSYVNRGVLLRDTGRLKEAETDYVKALSLYKQLAADFPNRPDLQSELANTCGNLAHHHLQQGNAVDAKRLLLEGRPHHLAALKANPRHPVYRQNYRSHLNELTMAHAGLLEPDDAVRTAETCRDLGWNAREDAYDAACFLSLCVPVVAKHDGLDASQRKEAEQFYGDAAMKLLRNAVSQGYKDVANIKKDTDLDPLRQRDDFRKLIAGLEGK